VVKIDNEHHRILICSANNTGVDNIAHRTQEVLTQLQQQGKADSKKHVIRLHSFEVEGSIAIREATLAREIPETARPKCIQEFEPEEIEILSRLEMAKLVCDEYGRATTIKFDGVYNKRVTDLDMSLDNRMR
jgi:hypothetical protein